MRNVKGGSPLEGVFFRMPLNSCYWVLQVSHWWDMLAHKSWHAVGDQFFRRMGRYLLCFHGGDIGHSFPVQTERHDREEVLQPRIFCIGLVRQAFSSKSSTEPHGMDQSSPYVAPAWQLELYKPGSWAECDCLPQWWFSMVKSCCCMASVMGRGIDPKNRLLLASAVKISLEG